VRIGEISRELETAKNQYATANGRQSKKETLKTAGISIRTANDYEQLTGGREEQAQAVAASAAEVYLAQQEEKHEAPTMTSYNRLAFEIDLDDFTNLLGERTGMLFKSRF
jgi:hypothetical protein